MHTLLSDRGRNNRFCTKDSYESDRGGVAAPERREGDGSVTQKAHTPLRGHGRDAGIALTIGAVQRTTYRKNPFIGQLLIYRDASLVNTSTHANFSLGTLMPPGPDPSKLNPGT